MKPRLLDLFCGAGGAAMGYHRAGFEVVGVDIKTQPHYPFEFVQADALTLPIEFLGQFDAIHASPPCQGYSRTRHRPWLNDKVHPMLIPAVRDKFRNLNVPWVIENVGDSPLMGIKLTGEMFGLPFKRLRIFESNILLFAPDMPKHITETKGRFFGERLRKQHFYKEHRKGIRFRPAPL